MRLVCKHCPQEFSSVDIRNEVAFKECIDNLLAHVTSKHTAWAKSSKEKIQKGIMLFMWIMTMNHHAAVPKGEEFINKEIEKYQGELMKALGFEEEKKEGGILV